MPFLRSLPSSSSVFPALPKSKFSLPLRSVHSKPRPPASLVSPAPTASASSASSGAKKSRHAIWYREMVPAMIPIFLLSTTLFLSLSLLRTHLSHSLTLDESSTRIAELELQLTRLRAETKRAREKEKRERERILPLVVNRVLQRVGAVGATEEVEEEMLV